MGEKFDTLTTQEQDAINWVAEKNKAAGMTHAIDIDPEAIAGNGNIFNHVNAYKKHLNGLVELLPEESAEERSQRLRGLVELLPDDPEASKRRAKYLESLVELLPDEPNQPKLSR